MRRFGLAVTLVLGLFPGAVAAQDWTNDPFDAGEFTTEELRTVQAALSFYGSYDGLLDGAWGRGSQDALESFTLDQFNSDRPTYADLVPLLQAWEEERQASGWEIMYLESTDTSYAHPFALLTQAEDESIIQFDAADDGLSLVVDYDDYDNTMGIHNYFLDQAMPFPAPYKSRKRDRIISQATMKGGLLAYIRSDAADGGFVTLSIVAAKEHRRQLAVMAGSMQPGQGTELIVPEGGVLAALVGADEAVTPSVEAMDVPGAPEGGDAVAQEPATEGDGPSGSGTGFFVNNTDLVTAAHVVEGCSRLTLADGAALTVLQADEAMDLAVLTADARSADWLELSADVVPHLGESVMALGYPYLGDLGQGLTVTGGNVSALQGIDGGKDRVMISAPVQPGNSGGPLLNGRGSVAGVVVSRVDDLAILEATGTLPQNMNFAVPNGPLVDFLRAAGVLFPQAQAETVDLSQGVPDRVSRAVVPIFCYE